MASPGKAVREDRSQSRRRPRASGGRLRQAGGAEQRGLRVPPPGDPLERASPGQAQLLPSSLCAAAGVAWRDRRPPLQVRLAGQARAGQAKPNFSRSEGTARAGGGRGASLGGEEPLRGGGRPPPPHWRLSLPAAGSELGRCVREPPCSAAPN